MFGLCLSNIVNRDCITLIKTWRNASGFVDEMLDVGGLL